MFLGKKRNPISQAALQQNISHIKVNKILLNEEQEEKEEQLEPVEQQQSSNNKKLIDKYFSKNENAKTKIGVGYDEKSKPKIHEASTEELKYKILDRFSEKKKKNNPKHLSKKKVVEDYDTSSDEEEEKEEPEVKKRKLIKQEATDQPDEDYNKTAKSKLFGIQQSSSKQRQKLKQHRSIADELVAQSQQKSTKSIKNA